MHVETTLDSMRATLAPSGAAWLSLPFGLIFTVVALPFAVIGYSSLLGIEPFNVWGNNLFGGGIFALLGTTHTSVGLYSLSSPFHRVSFVCTTRELTVQQRLFGIPWRTRTWKLSDRPLIDHDPESMTLSELGRIGLSRYESADVRAVLDVIREAQDHAVDGSGRPPSELFALLQRAD